MNTRFPRASVHLAALGAAFTAGWGLHPKNTREYAVDPAASRPTKPHLLAAVSSAGAAVPTDPATSKVPPSPLTDTQPIDALRSLAIPGSTSTPIERLQWLAAFAARDPETALTFIDTLPAGEKRDATATVMGAWAARDPESAATHLEENIDGFGLGPEAIETAAQAVALAWFRQDKWEALDWAASAPEEIRPAALQAAIGQLAANDTEAARLYFSSLSDAQARVDSAEPLAAQWAVRNPTEGAAWAAGLSAPAERAAALAGVTAAWMMRDPAAASRWVATLSAGHDRDAAIVAMVESPALRNDAAAAAAWAATLQDPVARQDLLPEALRRSIGQQDTLEAP